MAEGSSMISTIIGVFSLALLLFYFQNFCEQILRRQFEDPLPEPIVDANRLEFPYVRKTLEEFDTPLDYPRFSMHLKCDYLALVYLLKNAANQNSRLTGSERFLAVYFRVLSGSLAVLHLVKVGERGVLLKMTEVLEYFANVLGERIKSVRFGGNPPASEYLMSL
jgi:hypothetical protein